MPTVFSHIVQQRLSQESENIATAALAFILDSSEAARNGMMKLFCGAVPQMPRLWFQTQQTEGNARPDMWGYDDDAKPHVFIENKFWAGLTENQPVTYLRKLAEYPQPTMLLVVAPEAREQPLWRELTQRLKSAEISATNRDGSIGVVRSITTNIGPILALTSWTKLLSFLELEVADDRAARGDLLQLQALCDAVDSDGFLPISPEEITNQRTPAFLLQLNSCMQDAVQMAVTECILNLKGTTLQSSAERIGRYAYFGMERRAGVWLGINFKLWKEHGGTPLWAMFSRTDWGRAREVQAVLEPWAANRDVFAVSREDCFAVALNIPCRDAKELVVQSLVNRLREMADVLSVLKPKPAASPENE